MKRLASLLLAAALVAGLLAPATAAAGPRHRDLTGLVNATMGAFVAALREQSMEGFASRFVSFDNKSEELERAYRGLYPHAELFAQMGAFTPVLTDLASAGERNGLVVRGHYPGKYKIGFEMLFVLEKDDLKLIAFTVDVTPMAHLDA
jgi:hypothetical protein